MHTESLQRERAMNYFYEFFPKRALQETIVLRVEQEDPLPEGDYLLSECYCINVNCHCYNTIIQAQRHQQNRLEAPIATMLYCWKKPLSKHNPFLLADAQQTPWAETVRNMFCEHLESHPEYSKMLSEHYKAMREKARKLAKINSVCPCSSGRKFKKCCLLR